MTFESKPQPGDIVGLESHADSHAAQGLDPLPVTAGIWPIGMMGLWPKPLSELPSNFQLCDGTNGTLDMVDFFVVGAGNTYAVDDTGGSTTTPVLTHDNNHSNPGDHQHDAAGAHTHQLLNGPPNLVGTATPALQTITTDPGDHQHAATGGHTHTAHSNHPAGPGLPPYRAAFWVQRMS